jgi:hypothetical protein
MSKSDKAQSNLKPLTTLVYEFVKGHTPAAIHPALEAAFNSIVLEKDGFVRTGNRTAYNLDEEAFSSAKVEQSVNGGYVLAYSRMEGRRAHDIIRAILLHFGTFVFPPTPQENKKADGTPKMNSHPGQIEKWIKSLGFAQVEVGSGKRWQLSLAGTDELIAKIEELVPVLFEGTEKPSSTKVQIAFVSPAVLMGRTFYASLYNPDATGVDAAKFGGDVAWVRIALDAGYRFALVNKAGTKVLPPIAEKYLAAVEASKPQQEAVAS